MNMDINSNYLRTSTSPCTDCKPCNQKNNFGKMTTFVNNALSKIKYLSRSVRIFLFDLALVEGIEKHSSHPVMTLYVGEAKPPAFRLGKFYLKSEAAEKYANFRFVMESIYSRYTIIDQINNVNWLNINRMLSKYEEKADVVFIDTEFLFAKKLKRSHFLAIPPWVPVKKRLADRWDDVIISIPKNLRKKLNRIQNQGYQFFAAHTENQFNYFYHEMYVPYTQARFGDAAVIYSKDQIKKLLQKGEILFLSLKGRVLLGSLNKYEGDRLLLIIAAAADSLQPKMFKGAAEAIDYFSILSAFEKRCRVVDFLGSRPLLEDGAFRYKRKWGAYIDKFYRPVPDIYFKTLHLNAGVVSYLAHNPFIVKTLSGFRGHVLLDTPASSNDIESCACRYKTNGLNGIDIYCLAGIQNDARKFLASDTMEINIYDISTSPHPEHDFCKL